MDRRIFLQLAAASAALVGMPSRANTLDDITKTQLLRVAVLQDYPPFGTVGIDMQPKGLDIDVANLFAKKLGVKVQFSPVAGANRIPYLQTRKVDLIIGALGRNAEREKVIAYGPAYAQVFNGIFGAPEVRVSQASDLSGKTIGVSRGSTEDLQLTKIAPASVEIRRFEDSNGTMAAFLAGQVELIATGNSLVAAVSARNPDKKIETKFKMNDERLYIGLNKGEDALMARITAIASELKKDGSLSAINQKWLGTALPSDI